MSLKKMLIQTLSIVSCFAFALNVSASSTHNYDKITIISDLDDTVKITNVGNTTDAIRNGLFSDHFFAGMQELYSAMIPPNKSFYLVSGSVKYLRGKIENSLEENRMPRAELILKEFNDGNTGEYKIRKMRKIISESQGDFILVGDDTEFDPEVLLTIKQEFPTRVIATYIRSIRGIKLEAPLIPFLTAYEVAYHEVKARRLSAANLGEIEDALVNAREKLVIPPYVSCEQLPVVEKAMGKKLKEKIISICQKKEEALKKASSN